MTRELKCREVGFDCDAVVHAESDDAVMAQAATHVKDVHDMNHIDDATARRIRSLIHDS